MHTACRDCLNVATSTPDKVESTPSPGVASVATGGRSAVLDGVRGIAILLVLFHHVIIFSGLDRSTLIDRALLAVGSAAWIGVDVFFVLSGFLITGILYDAKGSQHYFTSFYGRRVLRIFPLYYGFLALVYLLGPLVLAPDVAEALHSKQGWYWTYLSNVDVALHGWSASPYLGHFWSLAIEEQFYLIWPWIVLACERRRLILVSVGCILVALTARTAVPFLMDPLAAYVLLPTRMDTLATGALVAVLVRGPEGREWLHRWAPVVLVVGVTWLGTLFLARRGLSELDPVVQTLGYSVIALSCGGMIATAVDGTVFTWLRRALCAAPLLFFGKYSYGLYVVHQPIMLGLADLGLQADAIREVRGSAIPGVLVFAVASVGASVAAALISWHLLEAPFLRLKKYLPYRAQDSLKRTIDVKRPAHR
jgi:peptidoglycan/LPS O-acetylase OafA/YrhL